MVKWEEKLYGRITGRAIARCLAMFQEIWAERAAWQISQQDESQWLKAFQRLAAVPNWTVYYQDTLIELLAKIAVVSGIGPILKDAVEATDPIAFLLDAVDSMPDEVPEHPATLPLAFAMIGNLDAIACYSRSINDMIQTAKQGDINALFAALSVDSMVSTMSFFQVGLRLGQLSGDSSSAEQVFRAIKGPHKKRLEYPELRWAEYLLRDQGAFETCSREEIYELVVEHLKIYDTTGANEDAKASLFKLFRSWQKQAGIQNPRFGFSAKGK
ncbi:MAG: hypothetical protein K0M64_11110 [Rhizobium sp.]|nr:hypothetical protein [Rhizobium sp.]